MPHNSRPGVTSDTISRVLGPWLPVMEGERDRAVDAPALDSWLASRTRSPPIGFSPWADPPAGTRSPETPKSSETWRLGPIKGGKCPASRPRTRMLDSSRRQRYSTLLTKKGV